MAHGCGLRASSCANLSLLNHFLEWARDITLALRSHLKAEFKRVENGPVSTRLRDAHIELYLMLVRALSHCPLDICTGRGVSAVPVGSRKCPSLYICPLN